jgi:hypothetical protein
MKSHYFFNLSACFIFFGIPSKSESQTCLIPQSITSTITPAGSTFTLISNLSLNITENTTENTEFPFAPSSVFSNDIGFVSIAGQDTGTITYTFSNTVSISRMLVWNGYFDIEPDNCIKDFDMVFRNASGMPVISYVAGLGPFYTFDGLKPQYGEFAVDPTGVKSVDIRIKALWGGDQISLRRIAFMGSEQTTGLTEQSGNTIQTYPNPAVNQLTIPEKEIESVHLMDLNGKSMEIEWVNSGEYSNIYWRNLTSGIYTLQITNSKGTSSSKVFIE